MILKDIVIAGNPTLKARSYEVEPSTIKSIEIQSFIADMFETMAHFNGAGLAAPQVGKNIRILTYGFEHNPRYPDAKPVPLTCMVNPVIIQKSENTEEGFEGCLSLGTLRGKVPRSTSLKVEYLDELGNQKIKEAAGFEARTIQHEIDHLDGVLFIQRVKDFDQFGFTDELKAHGLIP